MLKQRIITALIMASLIISAVIFLPTQILALALAVIICIGAWEWTTCTGFNGVIYKTFYVSVISLCLVACLFVMDKPWIVLVIFCGLLWWLIAMYMVICYQTKMKLNITPGILKAVIGIIILVPSWLSLILIHAKTSGVSLVLFLFLLIWLADISAYFSGRKFGNRKLASNVSPGKSWEGVYGAIIVSFLFAIAYTFYADMQFLHAVFFTVLVLITASFSILGDLVESMFKRMAGIKDSGNILPGHGGVLDRIDSLTSAAPVFFTGLWAIERIS